MPPTKRHPLCQHPPDKMYPKEKDGPEECILCELATWIQDKTHVPSIHDSLVTLAMSEKTHIDTLRILTLYLAAVVHTISDLSEGEVKYGHCKAVIDLSNKVGYQSIINFKSKKGD